MAQFHRNMDYSIPQNSMHQIKNIYQRNKLKSDHLLRFKNKAKRALRGPGNYQMAALKETWMMSTRYFFLEISRIVFF